MYEIKTLKIVRIIMSLLIKSILFDRGQSPSLPPVKYGSGSDQ